LDGDLDGEPHDGKDDLESWRSRKWSRMKKDSKDGKVRMEENWIRGSRKFGKVSLKSI